MNPSSPTVAQASAPGACLVLGGGVAGIAAAVSLAQLGVPVTLIETRLRLGGRATSFVDPTTGQILDNCQHVLMGCCTNLLNLYQRLGVERHIQWHRTIHFTDGSGAIDHLEADDLPAPLHLAKAMLSFQGLTWKEKLAIARGMAAILRTPRAHCSRWHRTSFAQWLSEHGQPEGAIEKFWAVVTVGAINEWPQRMAADYALQVFQVGFLAHENAYPMGLSAVPLLQLYDAAQSLLTNAGGKLLLSRSVEQLVLADGRITHVVLDGGETLSVGDLISALPFDRLAKICPPQAVACDPRLQRLQELEFSPIVGVHMNWELPQDQPIMGLPHLVLTRSPLQWIFNKGVQSNPESPSGSAKLQHLHAVISAAREWVDQPAQAILDMAQREVRQVLPAARQASLSHGRVVKEKHATFSARPGVDELRPPAGPDARGIGNLYLAGDWTRTGWPATMEGAVRSGYLAAQALLSQRGQTVRLLVDDLPPASLYRWLSGA